MPTVSYDPKCFDLAQHFLPKAGQKAVDRLAQAIQAAIEDELQPHYHECQQCGAIVTDECECDEPDCMTWCSSNCRAAFDL